MAGACGASYKRRDAVPQRVVDIERDRLQHSDLLCQGQAVQHHQAQVMSHVVRLAEALNVKVHQPRRRDVERPVRGGAQLVQLLISVGNSSSLPVVGNNIRIWNSYWCMRVLKRETHIRSQPR
jgi:hypothetical protein